MFLLFAIGETVKNKNKNNNFAFYNHDLDLLIPIPGILRRKCHIE